MKLPPSIRLDQREAAFYRVVELIYSASTATVFTVFLSQNRVL